MALNTIGLFYMEKEKAISLLGRQLTDIQAQADKILTGENSPEAIEAFARYSIELKKFILEKIDHPELNDAVNEIPNIDYRRTQIKMWQYVILPSWWISLYKDYQARKESIEEVTMIRGKFSSLQFLVNGLMH